MRPQDLKTPCRSLRARAPQEWDDFIRMFAEYTAETVDNVSEASADAIMEMKGRAQVCKALLHAFSNLDVPVLQKPSAP